jgi:hypothetical protein
MIGTVLGRVATFLAGGWLMMSAFAWPQAEIATASTCIGGALTIVYQLLAIFVPQARYLNTANAWVICLVSLSLDGASSAACANNVMVASVIFGASLLRAPQEAVVVQGACATSEGSKASSTG